MAHLAQQREVCVSARSGQLAGVERDFMVDTTGVRTMLRYVIALGM